MAALALESAQRLNGFLEFEVSDVRAFAKAIDVVNGLVDEACFEAKDNDAVTLTEMDPSHVSLTRLTLAAGDLYDLRTGNRVCLSLEKLSTVLGRKRQGEERVRLSATEDKVIIKFPETHREFSIYRLDIEPTKLPTPDLQFTATARIATREMKDVLKDMEDMTNVKLSTMEEGIEISAEDDEKKTYSKQFIKGDPGLMGIEVKAPATSRYNRDYLNKMTSKDFNAMTLRWGKDLPIEVSYNFDPPMSHSKLEFLLAPRIESE